ncbi:hypothetical protein BH10ACI3_BH10ACI3_02460 [soil metagenome]
MNRKFLILFPILLLCCSVAFGQDVKLKILSQPKPDMPQNYGTLDLQGSVILRIQFLDFGEIGEITPVKSLGGGLTERAVVAARKIKFEPEIMAGKPVTVTRQIEYYYSWNGGWSFPGDSAALAPPPPGEKGTADAIVAKAIRTLGGPAYMQVRSQVGRGMFSMIKDGSTISFQTFVDVLVFPDKERSDFKLKGVKTVQVNSGSTGWVYDGDQDLIKVQNEGQIASFRQAIRTSLDNLLRGNWKGEAELTYVGKRPATLGKRNDVLRLTYKDGFVVEFEFATDDGLPQKAVYKALNSDGEEAKEEDRYAQFNEISGVKAPFIVDRFTDGSHSSRINYESIEFNKPIPESIFAKPTNVKDAKKSWN